MSKRSMTPTMSLLYEEAKRLRLPNPLGRAAYATNRHWNDGVPDHWDGPISESGPSMGDSLTPGCGCGTCVMKRCRPETAQRWADHWLSGGSLKALCYGELEWNVARRDPRAERVSQGVVFSR